MSYKLLSLPVIVGLSAIFFHYRYSRRTLSLPPGPPKWPLFGNALQLPKDKPWLQFSTWAKEYGDLISVHIFGRTVIIINSINVATELFEKRGSIYSDRPRRVMANLCGFGPTLLLRKYDKTVREARKMLHSQLNPRAIREHYILQEQAASNLVYANLERPHDLIKNIRRLVTSIIMMIAFGHKTSDEDPLMSMAEGVMHNLSMVVTPNTYLVDALPFLRYMPSWLPGTGFQRKAKQSRELLAKFVNEPFSMVLEQLAEGHAPPSYVANILQGQGTAPTRESSETLMWTAADMHGGSETTISTISTFFLAMILHPEVQRTAQAEIDAVVGSGRLPTFSDRPSLPYIDCIVQEVFRWHPAVPFAGHSLRKDDIYRGFLIPANSLVSVNAWALTHNEEWYPNPDEFDPSRFMWCPKEGKTPPLPPPDPRTLVFGMGRRSCPGIHLATNMVYITIARTLATCLILPELDSGGMEIKPNVEYTSGAITHPIPFQCRVIPRFPDNLNMSSF